MSPKIVDKEKRKREIALATLEVFAEKGYEATSMSQVAELAGIGKGTIYEYFESKEELILSTVEAWVELMGMQAEKQLEGIDDPVERLKRYVQSAMEACVSDKRVVRLLIAMIQIMLEEEKLRSHRDLIRGTMQNAARFIVDTLLEGVSRGIFRPEVSDSAEKIAVNLLAYLDGISLYYYYMSRDHINLEAQVSFYLDNLLNGLRAEK
jgi:AcrR family transcriptional regulator